MPAAMSSDVKGKHHLDGDKYEDAELDEVRPPYRYLVVYHVVGVHDGLQRDPYARLPVLAPQHRHEGPVYAGVVDILRDLERVIHLLRHLGYVRYRAHEPPGEPLVVALAPEGCAAHARSTRLL